MAFELKEWLREGKDLYLLESLEWLILINGLILVMLELIKLQLPYGKHAENKDLIAKLLLTNFKLPARFAWFLMELPSLMIPLYLIFNVGGRYVGQVNPNVVLLGMFTLHYFNRVFFFSLTIKGNPVPIFVPLTALIFTSVNGFLQGRFLTQHLEYDLWWFADPRFIIGHLIFLFGMAANIHSDAVLRGLRQPGETGYKIPYGGLFEYVSGANYLSECVEWAGYAIACWSWPGFVMLAFTVMCLCPRALQHHRFYLKKFEDYPKNRTAFIPFLF